VKILSGLCAHIQAHHHGRRVAALVRAVMDKACMPGVLRFHEGFLREVACGECERLAHASEFTEMAAWLAALHGCFPALAGKVLREAGMLRTRGAFQLMWELRNLGGCGADLLDVFPCWMQALMDERRIVLHTHANVLKNEREKDIGSDGNLLLRAPTLMTAAKMDIHIAAHRGYSWRATPVDGARYFIFRAGEDLVLEGGEHRIVGAINSGRQPPWRDSEKWIVHPSGDEAFELECTSNGERIGRYGGDGLSSDCVFLVEQKNPFCEQMTWSLAIAGV